MEVCWLCGAVRYSAVHVTGRAERNEGFRCAAMRDVCNAERCGAWGDEEWYVGIVIYPEFDRLAQSRCRYRLQFVFSVSRRRGRWIIK